MFSAADPKTVHYLVEAFKKFSISTGLVAENAQSQIAREAARPTRNNKSLSRQGIKKESCHLGILEYPLLQTGSETEITGGEDHNENHNLDYQVYTICRNSGTNK